MSVYVSAGVEGEVLLDGEPTPPDFRLISGYVVQDDVVMATLTVRENLLFSANLRLSTNISLFDKMTKVERIIHQLGRLKKICFFSGHIPSLRGYLKNSLNTLIVFFADFFIISSNQSKNLMKLN